MSFHKVKLFENKTYFRKFLLHFGVYCDGDSRCEHNTDSKGAQTQMFVIKNQSHSNKNNKKSDFEHMLSSGCHHFLKMIV